MSGYSDSSGGEDRFDPEDVAGILLAQTELRSAAVRAFARCLADVYSAGVLWLLWGWFLVPLGVPPVTVAHAAGIGVISAVLTLGLADRARPRTDWSPLPESCGPFLFPTYLLLLGGACRVMTAAGF